jgi:hypothetical protein
LFLAAANGAEVVIDPAARTQDIESQLDMVNATLHKVAAEVNLILNDPYGAKAQVLACKMPLEDIARNIDETFPMREGRDDDGISRAVCRRAELDSAGVGLATHCCFLRVAEGAISALATVGASSCRPWRIEGRRFTIV